MKKLRQKKERERILGLLNGVEGRAFFGKRCCKNVRTPSGRKKEDWKDFSKVGCQVFLSKEIILGHPCVPRVRVSKGGDKDQAWERRGGAGAGGERGRDRGRDIYEAQRVNAELHVINCDLALAAAHHLVFYQPPSSNDRK